MGSFFNLLFKGEVQKVREVRKVHESTYSFDRMRRSMSSETTWSADSFLSDIDSIAELETTRDFLRGLRCAQGCGGVGKGEKGNNENGEGEEGHAYDEKGHGKKGCGEKGKGKKGEQDNGRVDHVVREVQVVHGHGGKGEKGKREKGMMYGHKGKGEKGKREKGAMYGPMRNRGATDHGRDETGKGKSKGKGDAGWLGKGGSSEMLGWTCTWTYVTGDLMDLDLDRRLTLHAPPSLHNLGS